MALMRHRARLAEIREEIEGGELARAERRLRDMARSLPHDEEVRDLLGLVLFRSGDRLTAARHWFLSSRQDADSAEARALQERFTGGDPVVLLDFLALPHEALLHARDPVVRARLAELERRLVVAGAPPERADARLRGWRRRAKQPLACLGCALAALLMAGLALGALVAIARRVADYLG